MAATRLDPPLMTSQPPRRRLSRDDVSVNPNSIRCLFYESDAVKPIYPSGVRRRKRRSLGDNVGHVTRVSPQVRDCACAVHFHSGK